MNYFAHLFLAQPTTASTVGNLLGDFARGVELATLPEAVLAGLLNHRAVDRYTDAHAIVLELKRGFSPQRRRFAGIALDVCFDHLLMRHWARFDSRPLELVIEKYYQRMLAGQHLMPSDSMRATTSRIVEQDWFSSYRELASIGAALDRIAARIRFENRFAGVIEELERDQAALEQGFLQFLPELIEHVQLLGIEASDNFP